MVAAGADLRVLDEVDAGDQAVGGGEHVARVPFIAALRIAEEEQQEEADDERRGPQPGRPRKKSSPARNQKGRT